MVSSEQPTDSGKHYVLYMCAAPLAQAIGGAVYGLSWYVLFTVRCEAHRHAMDVTHNWGDLTA